jgi:hypothetical protein
MNLEEMKIKEFVLLMISIHILLVELCGFVAMLVCILNNIK